MAAIGTPYTHGLHSSAMTSTRGWSAITSGLAQAVLLTCLVASSGPAFGQSRSELIRERVKTRPDDPTLYYYLAGAEFAEGDKAGGLEALDKVATLGSGFLPIRDLGFETVWNDRDFQKVRDRLEKKLPKVTNARELFRLDQGLIPEGIAFDPVTRSYFVGSIAQRKIVRVDSAGVASDFSRPGELGQVLGLVVDLPRRHLHAVNTSLIAGDTSRTRNRVVTYDITTGALAHSVVVAGAGQLNDVTVGPGGELYTTDSRAGGVYRIRPGSDVVDSLVTLPGVNGIAVSDDGNALYLAHSTGIGRYELSTGNVLPRIEVPRGETIAGIDGLYVHGATLIGIQNVTNPGRVIRIHLRADGKGVEQVETLLSHHHPALDEPTTGAIVGRSFTLLATTQVARFQPDGTVASPQTVKPPVALAIPLDPKRAAPTSPR